jgi:ribosomal protein L7/L12
MSTVVLDWPAGMQERIAEEVAHYAGLGDGTAEEVVDIVAAHLVLALSTGRLRLSPPPPEARPALPPEHIVEQARALVREDRWIDAIKLLREHSTLGLRQGKEMVDQMRAEVGRG